MIFFTKLLGKRNNKRKRPCLPIVLNCKLLSYLVAIHNGTVIGTNNMYFEVFNRHSTIFSTKTCCNGIFVCENEINLKLITFIQFLECVQHVCIYYTHYTCI